VGLNSSIIFFGSGPVAAKSLQLLAQDCTIEAIITKPSTLEEMTRFSNAPTYAVSSKVELDSLITEKHFTSRVGIVIDFGIIISRQVIDSFPKGIVNSHFSLLPEWRGADPISFAILSGQSQTGVSLMLINEKMDEGDLLSQSPYNIPDNITITALTQDLIELSASSLKQIIPRWLADDIQTAPQADVTIAQSTEPTYSRKLTKADSVIDWNKPAVQIEREIRAFLEWPKSKTTLGTIDVVITASKVVSQQIEPCGKIWVENKQLFVSCGKDSLEILALKPAGKKEMPAKAFLAGYRNRLEI
jgi:methionyl-tRNA formyltransferase